MRRSCWWVRGFSRGRWVGQRNGMHVGVPLQWDLWGFGKTFWRVPKWLCWGLAGEFGRKKRECPRETRGHLDSSIKCPMSVTSVSWIASIFAPFLLNAPARIEAIISNWRWLSCLWSRRSLIYPMTSCGIYLSTVLWALETPGLHFWSSRLTKTQTEPWLFWQRRGWRPPSKCWGSLESFRWWVWHDQLSTGGNNLDLWWHWAYRASLVGFRLCDWIRCVYWLNLPNPLFLLPATENILSDSKLNVE